MARIHLAITTYNRPEKLSALVEQLFADKTEHDVDIHIYNDGSTVEYEVPVNTHYKRTDHYGKESYWGLVNQVFSDTKDKKWDYFIQIPDDISIYNPFFDECVRLWEQIPDEDKGTLTLDLKQGRRLLRQWTRVQPYEVMFGGDRYYKTGWVDLCFICNRRLMEQLEYKVNPLPPATDPTRGTGVGPQLSKRILASGMTCYQVTSTMTHQGIHKSMMHGGLRDKQPSIKNRERVIASVASIPERAGSLRNVVNALIDQVDLLKVHLNNYVGIPTFLDNPKIVVYTDKDRGDSGKFYKNDEYEGYVLTVDDDLAYPKDYVADIIGSIERYGRKVVVSYHGRILKDTPISSFYNHSCKAVFRCTGSVVEDTLVHMGGTGVMGFHTDLCNPSINIFEVPNMADIWMGRYCQKRDIPIVVIKHELGWITHCEHVKKEHTIAHQYLNNDTIQTDAINSIDWGLTQKFKAPYIQAMKAIRDWNIRTANKLLEL